MLFRKYLKESSALHTNYDGEELAADLIAFSYRANNNFNNYAESKENDTPYEHDRVYVTMNEKIAAESIENKTKEQLRNKILAKINELNDSSKNLFTEVFTKEVKKRNKATYIEFLYRLNDLNTTNENVNVIQKLQVMKCCIYS